MSHQRPRVAGSTFSVGIVLIFVVLDSCIRNIAFASAALLTVKHSHQIVGSN
jgi:hypothetical protein